jgi:hypothetical protein
MNGANVILLNAVAIIAHKLRQELGSNSKVLVAAWEIPEASLDTEDVVEVTTGNVLMGYTTC